MYFAIYFVSRTLAFFCSRVSTMAVLHCFELSRAMKTGITQCNKIGRDEQYETEDEFYALVFTFMYKNLIDDR